MPRRSTGQTDPVTTTSIDERHLRRAIELAGRGATTALPNPVVGCVILDRDGDVVGEGWHVRPGEAHAEVNALAEAGGRAVGGTAYVSLEPCNHTGRTGPCSQALIAAGIARVVVAITDPNPQASGGIATLRAAGVLVEVGLLADEARDMNRVWLVGTALRRPFVTWKAGMTVDGRVAAVDGTSKWITSPESRADVHLLRARVDTMVVGVGTVLADDPHLTVRDRSGHPVGRQPLRVVVDSAGRTPEGARVRDAAAETWIATAAEVGGDASGRVDLFRLMDLLYRRGRRHLLVEGGPRLAAAFLDAGLVDEVLIYLAPLALGAGRTALDGGDVVTLAQAHRLELRSVDRFGDDVRLRYRARPS